MSVCSIFLTYSVHITSQEITKTLELLELSE